MTIYDIAKEARVSASTVSRVINNKPGIKAETREKVKAVIKKYSFEADETARGLVKQASKTIGLLLADVRIGYYMEGVHIIIAELARCGYCCILMNTGVSDSNRAEYIKILSQRKVEGAILIGSAYQCEPVREAIEKYMSAVPVVMVNGYLDMPNVYGILAGEREGTRRCIDFVLKRGYKRPAFISGAATVSNTNKLEGFKDSLKKNGVRRELPAYFCEEAIGCGYDITKRLLDEHPETDVIFYSSDCFAVAGLRMLHELGVRVPEDIGVISGEESFYSTLAHPLITSLDSKIEDICMLACHSLTDILHGKEVKKTVTLESEINERETTR